ncbi:hypothetical protein OG413_31925 [Streptomyces sp. NBC_01433]|uniref:hypothetical protein n=1 Tax=Streptomyces sp. NBC_01433 TaxID=2903864 RepID=UPI0022538E4D|nr:hypothetical protein [Streptomyces sp. NBC_01433]MCX4679836.1 hypothetical protein [Streptomyces sp. NBC_01433]
MLAPLTELVAPPAAIRHGFVTWFIRLITPESALTLPRPVLAPPVGEPVRIDLSGQVARL